MKKQIDKSALSQMVVEFFDNGLNQDQQPILLKHLKESSDLRKVFEREGNARDWMRARLKVSHPSKLSPESIKRKLGLN